MDCPTVAATFGMTRMRGDARTEILRDLVEGAPGGQGHDARVGASDHDGGDLLDNRALVLGLDSQDDDVKPGVPGTC